MKNNEELVFTLDLETASNAAFQQIVSEFYAWSETQPALGPLALANGWHTVTPLMNQEFLRRNVANRKANLGPVKKYAYSMHGGEWRKTGQGLVFNADGDFNDGQHRAWAGYLGRVSFETYIITDTPVQNDMFAYYDDLKVRSAADALSTSGLDGISLAIASAAVLSYYYENGALNVLSIRTRIHRPNNREILAYSRTHPSLVKTAHIIVANYPKAVALLRHKGVAVLFADLVINTFGLDALNGFLVSLGSGANLEEDSPILGLRTRLLTEESISKERCLALALKAFKYHRIGKRLAKSGLYVRDNEKFPTLETDSPEQAAE